MDKKIATLAGEVAAVLTEQKLTLAVAESCTGGGLCQALTDIPGSSAWFDRGFITYSNQAKIEMLGVSSTLLEQYGAVSFEAARAMVEGVHGQSNAELAIAITGIAGPDGGTAEKPVGTVFFGIGQKGQAVKIDKRRFKGGREEVRARSVEFVLKALLKTLA
ncbi:MAG: CinA family protein [Methylococcales bacterium]|nr:CinA family protein [Acidiferrobacteraceae bacterium]MBT4031688.1 CinA family protein [Methylococcales bacterium]MBT4598839.1 CinA family protein [Methylococcales bacterium]